MATPRWALPLALVALLIVAFAMTNPDKGQFAATYADRFNAQLAAQAGLTGTVGQILGGVTQNAIEAALSAQAKRQNYLVASVYTVPMSGPDLRVLGVLGHFYTLQKPSSQ
jgi:hypothetical protein